MDTFTNQGKVPSVGLSSGIMWGVNPVSADSSMEGDKCATSRDNFEGGPAGCDEVL